MRRKQKQNKGVKSLGELKNELDYHHSAILTWVRNYTFIDIFFKNLICLFSKSNSTL
jgi:hypothetical protein